MTDIRKLAARHAKEFDDPKVKSAIVRALKEYQASTVIDVLLSDPSTSLVAERIVRTRPIPFGGITAYQGSHVRNRITFKQLVEYAVEMGRELERRGTYKAIEPHLPAQEFGWEWASNPSTGPHLIHGADTLEAAEQKMAKHDEAKWPPIRIMVREGATPWREA